MEGPLVKLLKFPETICNSLLRNISNQSDDATIQKHKRASRNETRTTKQDSTCVKINGSNFLAKKETAYSLVNVYIAIENAHL